MCSRFDPPGDAIRHFHKGCILKYESLGTVEKCFTIELRRDLQCGVAHIQMISSCLCCQLSGHLIAQESLGRQVAKVNQWPASGCATMQLGRLRCVRPDRIDAEFLEPVPDIALFVVLSDLSTAD